MTHIRFQLLRYRLWYLKVYVCCKLVLRNIQARQGKVRRYGRPACGTDLPETNGSLPCRAEPGYLIYDLLAVDRSTGNVPGTS